MRPSGTGLESGTAPGVQIREAVAADAERIAAIHVASWRRAYRGLMTDELLQKLDPSEGVKSWRSVLNRPEYPTLVALRDSEPAGFITVGPSRDDDRHAKQRGEISALYVAPEHWRGGLGSALLQYGREVLAERGAREIALWVLADYEPARRFYEKHGFEPDGARKRHASSGLLEVRYILRGGLEAESP